VSRLRPNFIDRLAATTGIQLSDADFLPLAEGDALTGKAFEGRKQLTPDITWREGNDAHVTRTLDAFSSALGGQAAYLVGHASVESPGVPLLPVAPLLKNVFQHWERRREDVILLCEGAGDGCFLEWDSCYGYELTTWGLVRRSADPESHDHL